MKKIIVCSLISCSLLFSAEAIAQNNKGCVETLEDEIAKIVNSNIDDSQKKKAIEELKAKIYIDDHESCESEFQDEIKKIIFGEKKNDSQIATAIKEKTKELKESVQTADMNSQDCIENFEAEIRKIIDSNPNNLKKEETKNMMHELLHEKVKESCESEFEKDTKRIVNSEKK
ncbi:hypothetical protein ACKGJI_11735 [Sulfurospirillum sp. 1307]|jgi:hypothetical protein